jgi:hypothetical protein
MRTAPTCRLGRRQARPGGRQRHGRDGASPTGNFGILEAAREAAEAKADYALAGLVETIEITPLSAQFRRIGSIR